jgi:uncharacterized membrane protein
VAAVADPQEQLAWERRQRVGAGIAGLLAGLLTLGGDLWSQTIFRSVPESGFLESLGRVARPGPVGELESVRTPFFEWYQDHAGPLLASSVVRGLGLLFLGWAVAYLGAATHARRPELPRLVIYATVAGAVLSAISTVLGTVGSATAVSSFLDGPRTVDAAADVAGGSLLITSQILGLIGQLALAGGLIVTSLNAMRAGLLSRFIGILGMIVALLMVIPILPQLPVVQAFWLVTLGLIFLGRAPGGVPPAWRTGKAEPWPSSQELAEARRKQTRARRGGARAPEPEPEPAAVAAPGREHPSSKKRKRKRRD